MSGTELKQRLAAILAADVAGYSRLMAADERATVASLDAARRVFKSKIESNQGRVIDMAGDSVLAVFETATGAVSAAVAVQQELNVSWSAVPEDRRMRFRIGVHLGDVIEKTDGTVYGDGINIAARLEGLSEPGGITVSDSIRNAVMGKVGATFEDQGAQKVKNIPEPVRAYRVKVEGDTTSKPSSAVGEIDLSLPDKPSIVVLAFANMSGDQEQEYFTDGVAEDIITALSRSRGMFVIARNSSFAYKGRPVDVKQIGKELGVRYVLEGSVRKSANRVRITAQLVEAKTGVHLWAERYDRDLTDIFAVQDEITASVAQAIEPALAHAERDRAVRKPPQKLDAWEAYHRGLWHFLKQEAKENDRAKEFFQRAVELDPEFAGGYIGLALICLWDGCVYLSRPMSEAAVIGQREAQRALAIDDADAMAHLMLGWSFQLQGDIVGWRAEIDRAIALNPNNAWAIGSQIDWEAFQGTREGAIAAASRAMRASPHDPLTSNWIFWIMIAHYFANDYEATLEVGERLMRLRPHPVYANFYRAAALGQLGRLEEARIALQQALAITSNELIYEFVRKRPPYRRSADHALLVEGLRKAGLEDPSAADASR